MNSRARYPTIKVDLAQEHATNANTHPEKRSNAHTFGLFQKMKVFRKVFRIFERGNDCID